MSVPRPRPTERWRPALPPQVTMWLLHQLDARLPENFVPLALRYDGVLPPHLLQQALGEIVRRHAVLRWQFRTTRGSLEFVEHPWKLPAIPIVRIDGIGTGEGCLRPIVRSVMARPFAIDDYPLFRILHVTLGPRAGLVLAVFHHALADGWSTAVLGTELAALWTRLGRGLTSTLPDLQVRYADLWTPDRIAGRGGPSPKAQRQFWQDALGDLDDASAWPWPHWKTRDRDVPIRRCADRLDPAEAAAIVREAGALRASPFVFFAALLSVLRWRLSGRTRTVIGTDTAGRTEPAAEALIGFFINLLPLRLDVDPAGRFVDHLADTRRRCLTAYEQQGLPFEEIVRAVEAPRGAGRNPLFNVKLMLHNFLGSRLRLPGAMVTGVPVTLAGSGEDVKLIVRPLDGSYVLDWEARGDALSQAEVEAVARLFRQAIREVLADPGISLQALLSAADVASADPPMPAAPLDLDVAARVAQARDEDVLLRVGGIGWSVEAFAQQVARLRGGLRAQGVGPGVLVGSYLPPSVDSLLCTCAVLGAGGAFINLDPRDPADVIQAAVRAAQPAVIVSGDDAPPTLPEPQIRHLRLEQLAMATPSSAEAETHAAGADVAAFVDVAPDGLVHRFTRAALATQIDAWSRVWHDAPGSAIVHAEPEDALALFADLIVCLEQRRTLMIGPAAPAAGCCYARLPVRALSAPPAWLAGGDRCADVVIDGRITPSDCTAFRRSHPNTRLHVVTPLPGVALAGSHVEWHDEWTDLCGVPVSPAWGGVTLHLLDAARRLAPVTGIGEIYASGAVAMAADAREPLLATGLRGLRLADGRLLIIGPTHTASCASGRAIDPARVASVLRQHPAVADAIVLSGAGVGAGWTAFVTAAGEDLRAEQLWSLLAGRLTRQAMPDALRVVPALPLDRRGRPVPPIAASAAEPQAVADPASALLRAELATIWRELLGSDRAIAPEDDFFHLGGDSILATRLAFRIEEVLGVELSVADIFAHRTFAGLAARLSGDGAATVSPVKLAVVDRTTLLPLASAQNRLFFLHRLNPSAADYHCPIGLELRGRPNLLLLVQAFTEVVRRQDALRTLFLTDRGEPKQRVLPRVQVSPVWIDLTAIEPARRPSLTGAIRRADLRRPFRLEAVPAFRVIAANRGGGVWELSLTAHHLISDAWSERILIHELNRLAARYAIGRASDLAPLAFQYGDYVVWQAARLQGRHLAQLTEGWSDLTARADLEPIRFPTRDAKTREPGRVGYRRFAMPSALAEALDAVGRTRGATLYMVALAAFQCLLHRLTGQPRLTCVASATNRYPGEMLDVIGFFANTFPVASTWDAGETVTALLERTREYLVEALRLQELPFDQIVDAIRRRRPGVDPSRLNVSFVMTPALDGGGISIPGTAVRSIVTDDVHPKFDLELQLNGGADGFAGTLEYATSFLTADMADALVSGYLGILEGLVRPAAPRAVSRPTTGLRRPVAVSARPKPANGARSDDQFPAVITCGAGTTNTLDTWCDAHRDELATLVKRRGAILFRQTSVTDVAGFRRFVQRLTPDLMHYTERSSPRRDLAEQVYTSTEYPADEHIFFHNECSYSRTFPRALFFYCDRPAATGGETMLCDSRKVYERLRDDVRDRFERSGVIYARHYSGYLDLPWQTAFQTQDTHEVERYCEAAGIDWQWTPAGGLKTRQLGPAVLRHPDTGEMVWFNQAHMFHLSALKDEYRSALLAMLDEHDLPRQAFMGDGSPIAAGDLAEIRATYESLACAVRLERGDIVWIDNVLCAHGRKAFTGERRLAVIMSDPMHASK